MCIDKIIFANSEKDIFNPAKALFLQNCAYIINMLFFSVLFCNESAEAVGIRIPGERTSAGSGRSVAGLLFQQRRVAQHLLAGGNAEFFQNIVIVEFEGAFADVEEAGDLFCGFALQIEVEDGFFGFGQFFQPDSECLVVIRVDLALAGICQSFDLCPMPVDFDRLRFRYAGELVILPFQAIRFEVAEPILLGEVEEEVVDFDNVGVGLGSFLSAYPVETFYHGRNESS